MSRSEEDKFIGKLLEETYREIDPEMISNEACYDYFQKKAKDEDVVTMLLGFAESFGVNCTFLSSLNCYRCDWNNYRLDFPINWSLFEGFGVREENPRIELVDSGHDKDKLFDVFKYVDSGIQKMVIAKLDDRVVLIPIHHSNADEWSAIEKCFMEAEAAFAA